MEYGRLTIVVKLLRLARQAIKNIYRDAVDLVDSEERRKLINWGLASESAPKMQAMVKLAESGKGIPISPDDLDLKSMAAKLSEWDYRP